MSPATWPDRFTYVCIASRAAIANALPLFQAGFERVEEVVILCGVKDTRNPTSNERSEALLPASWLEALVRRRNPRCRIRRFYGDPEVVVTWRAHVATLAGSATAACPLLFNLTTGRRQMSYGAMLGVLHADPAAWSLLLIGTGPLRVEVLDIRTSAQHRTPMPHRITLAEYLETYGCAEHESEARERAQARMLADRGAMLVFGRMIMDHFTELEPMLTASTNVEGSNDGRPMPPFIIRPLSFAASTPAQRQLREHFAAAIGQLDGIHGLQVDRTPRGPEVTVTTAEQRFFLRGGWLESYLYLRLFVEFGHLNHVDIAVGVKVRRETTAEGRGQQWEFDIAIVVKDQLHVVEAKAGKAVRAADVLPKASWVKNELLGQFGRFYLVLAKRNLAAPENVELESRAERIGVMVHSGPEAVEAALDSVRRAVKQA